MFYEYFMLTAVLSATFIRIKKLTCTNVSGTGFPLEFKLCRTKAFCLLEIEHFKSWCSHLPLTSITAFGKLNYVQVIQKCDLSC